MMSPDEFMPSSNVHGQICFCFTHFVFFVKEIDRKKRKQLHCYCRCRKSLKIGRCILCLSGEYSSNVVLVVVEKV